MLVLYLFAPADATARVMDVLRAEPAAVNLLRGGTTDDGGRVLITAEVQAGTVDALLPRLESAGVPGDDISIIHRDTSRPLGRLRGDDLPAWSGGALAWTELATASRQYARAVPQYLTFMGCAGVIAAFGVLTKSATLIVGAMAISPDLLPLCAMCVGLADHRFRLAGRAFAVLIIGMAMAALTALLVTLALRASGYGPAHEALGDGGLGILPTVNAATVLVALAAGVAGILSFETRASSAVGVAISITTIPAAAFLGVAVAEGDSAAGGPAAAVLAVNAAMLVLAGTLTLLVQRARGRRHSA
ncbi:hypothetical protein ACTI_50920 [Actinoplanes sp. OR16]|uniref:DUF389 domain-containing protein n=1 Tax=Actinoplanes sp. OR16 TaxID=946334 RepID=UPI000F6F3837|nr:DUF389 domain-containing protein [Actinoplanes sp. OR16]BBH68407.1 hypothetical protein ACTI_50920 [Actinoplanes sp. OR16]